jgi:hypothetical protein
VPFSGRSSNGRTEAAIVEVVFWRCWGIVVMFGGAVRKMEVEDEGLIKCLVARTAPLAAGERASPSCLVLLQLPVV